MLMRAHRILQIVLAVATLLFAGRILAPLRSGPARSGAPASGTESASDPATPLSVADYAVIERRDLFGSAPPLARLVEEPPVVATRLQLHVRGTVVRSPAHLSMGFLEGEGLEKTTAVAVGDVVANGRAKIVRIEQRRVVVDHEGRLEAIEMDSSVARAPRTVSAARPVSRPATIPQPKRFRDAGERARDRIELLRARGEALQGDAQGSSLPARNGVAAPR